ncbi:MAG: DNA repair protein RecO [Solirubrobacteraceae bacterium]|jgi:DNA repair protein RecO (recombination protein O)
MAGPVKTDAIVLRSLRYGEADRILHLYTPARGRIGAIAKGVRRTRSRFGGRLEPFCRVALICHEGRGELLTVTGAETLESHGGLRDHAATLDAAARACDAVARIFETSEPHPGVYNLLANELTLLATDPAQATPANALAFRLKLLVAAGLAPALASCASCGVVENLVGYSPSAGGVVCSACEAGAFPFAQETHSFMTQALAHPLAQTPQASPRALREADRAISETLEHHAHLHLRPATAAPSR